MKEKIIKILTQNMGLDIKGNENKLIQNHILDSLAIMDLVGYLEDEFDIQIDFKEIIEENLNSIESIINMVIRLQK